MSYKVEGGNYNCLWLPTICSFLANAHGAYFIKRKAAIYIVASGGYTRSEKREKHKTKPRKSRLNR
jgi:hypothetical protein